MSCSSSSLYHQTPKEGLKNKTITPSPLSYKSIHRQASYKPKRPWHINIHSKHSIPSKHRSALAPSISKLITLSSHSFFNLSSATFALNPIQSPTLIFFSSSLIVCFTAPTTCRKSAVSKSRLGNARVALDLAARFALTGELRKTFSNTVGDQGSALLIPPSTFRLLGDLLICAGVVSASGTRLGETGAGGEKTG